MLIYIFIKINLFHFLQTYENCCFFFLMIVIVSVVNDIWLLFFCVSIVTNKIEHFFIINSFIDSLGTHIMYPIPIHFWTSSFPPLTFIPSHPPKKVLKILIKNKANKQITHFRANHWEDYFSHSAFSILQLPVAFCVVPRPSPVHITIFILVLVQLPSSLSIEDGIAF